MKRLLCLLLLVASSTEAAYHVKAWKPAGESRFILQCIADAVIDLPTCASVSDGFDCRVLATNELYLCDGATWSAVGGSPGGISDGDKGDITVSSSGSVLSVDANSIDLGTDTVGGYAGSSTEGGAATSALAVTGFSASKCARFDGSGNLVAASGDCSSGDTTGSGAPTTTDYLVKTADAGLSAERVVTDTPYVTWDWGTAGQAKATAVDVNCTGCLGGTEVDESTLGTVPTATALATNPADCSTSDGTETPWRINASGDLSCVAIAFTSKTLDRKTSATTVNNTVTETAVYSYTIPANTLDANSEIVLNLLSEFLNNTGVSRGYIIKVKLGGATVIEFDMGSSALVSTATRRLSQTVVSLDALGATNSQIVTMRHEISSRTGLSGTLTTGVGTTMSTAVQMLTVNSGTLSQDMTTSKVLEVSITLSTNSTNLEWKAYAGTLELLNP